MGVVEGVGVCASAIGVTVIITSAAAPVLNNFIVEVSLSWVELLGGSCAGNRRGTVGL